MEEAEYDLVKGKEYHLDNFSTTRGIFKKISLYNGRMVCFFKRTYGTEYEEVRGLIGFVLENRIYKEYKPDAK